MIPLGWTITAKGNYLCMCKQFKTDNLSDVKTHMSEFEGFCSRGLRCISNDKFECICGEQFIEKVGWKTPEYQSSEHICIQMEGLIKVCIKRYRNKCQKCNLQLDSPAALKLHYTTKSHVNFEDKVDLHCKVCDIHYRGQKEMKTHLLTKKHNRKSSVREP